MSKKKDQTSGNRKIIENLELHQCVDFFCTRKYIPHKAWDTIEEAIQTSAVTVTDHVEILHQMIDMVKRDPDQMLRIDGETLSKLFLIDVSLKYSDYPYKTWLARQLTITVWRTR